MKKLYAMVLALALLAGCGSGQLSPADDQPTATEATPSGAADIPSTSFLDCLYYSEKTYETTKQKATAYETGGTVMAGIIPHHGTASRMIASFFKALDDSYDTVIVIGPNHYGTGGAVVYSDCGWKCEKGSISSDGAFAELLKKDLTINANLANEVVQNDHSIGWQLPYMAEFLPSAQVSAIMLDPSVDVTTLKALAELIVSYSREKKVLLLGSVDFSHYLMPEEAQQMDELTKLIIDTSDYGGLLSLTSDNVDCPQAVYVVMKVVESLGSRLELLDQSISYMESGDSKYDVDPAEGTTTYLVYAATTADNR